VAVLLEFTLLEQMVITLFFQPLQVRVAVAVLNGIPTHTLVVTVVQVVVAQPNRAEVLQMEQVLQDKEIMEALLVMVLVQAVEERVQLGALLVLVVALAVLV
jgi:hypothetical protein